MSAAELPPDDQRRPPADPEGDQGQSVLEQRPDRGLGPDQSEWISPRQVSRVLSLIQILEAELPAPYRVEAFRALVPTLLHPAPSAVGREGREPSVGQPTARPRMAARAQLDLARYSELLRLPGRMLQKALAALDVASEQLEIRWMTPAEIERLLAERGGVRSVYRTNLSSALGSARGVVDRRRRGRGYEYRITTEGREVLQREVALLGG